jgi:hypothetical protein
MRRVCGDRLAGCRAREQAQEGREITLTRDDLFETDACDMQSRERRPEIGIAFIRDDDETAGLCDREIDAGEPGFCIQESMPEVSTRDIGEFPRIIEVGRAAHLLRE